MLTKDKDEILLKFRGKQPDIASKVKLGTIDMLSTEVAIFEVVDSDSIVKMNFAKIDKNVQERKRTNCRHMVRKHFKKANGFLKCPHCSVVFCANCSKQHLSLLNGEIIDMVKQV